MVLYTCVLFFTIFQISFVPLLQEQVRKQITCLCLLMQILNVCQARRTDSKQFYMFTAILHESGHNELQLLHIPE